MYFMQWCCSCKTLTNSVNLLSATQRLIIWILPAKQQPYPMAMPELEPSALQG